MLWNVWVTVGVNVSSFAVGIAVGVYFTVRRLRGGK